MIFINDDDDKKHDVVKQVDEVGDQDISGTNADLESDDNVLDAAHGMGLYQNADEEHPQELGIAEEVEKAEKDRIEND